MKFWLFCIALIIALFFVGVLYIYTPHIHFWKTNYEQGISWCKLNKPMMNSSDNEYITFCYGEGWEDYCKISYPSYCKDAISGGQDEIS